MDTAQRRACHETLCRIAQANSIRIKSIDVPWLVDALEALEGLSIEQGYVLGTFIAGSAAAAIRATAANN